MKSREEFRTKGRLLTLSAVRWSSAAMILLFLMAGLFARFYTKTVTSPAGNHLTVLLPDGSGVEMNAGSVIKFRPWWWPIQREVNFEGEAFFKVKKGKSFEVVSSLGRTIVLGTSFNIYARQNQYRVTCYTGRVRVVVAGSGHSADIVPNDEASLNRDGTLHLTHLSNPEEISSWRNHKFFFTGTPLALVFQEIERQYGVTIFTKGNTDYLYTGNFTGERAIEEVLNMVCRPYGLDFNPVANGFLISKKQPGELAN
jgi:ferric-dicitrate binding protein FerR (iron transport regulator)